MVNKQYSDLFQNDSIDKQLKIEFDGGVITNEELHNQQFELIESLCSESELRFGSCEASTIKFKISNIFMPLKDKWLTVSMTLQGTDEPFLIGKYKVFSDVPTADRKYRNVVAYDAMYDIINADVSAWYNTVFPNKDAKVTLRQLRTSFISYFGLEQEEADLVNDNMIVEKTVEVTPSSLTNSGTSISDVIGESMSGKEVISSICEINGCFGHIGRNGKFKWIYLPQLIQGLYPANDLYPDHAPDYLPYQQEKGHLYPQDPKSTGIGKGFYISASYEDFFTKEIKKLQIRQKENDIGAIVGTDGNTYIIEDNFLVYGKNPTDLASIADRVLGKIKGIIYIPFDADCKGNPCFEVGDPVRLSTKYKMIESYILQRTIKGIQALRDNFSAEGVEEYVEKVNSMHKSIVQLKGKTNELERNVEETKSTITNVEEGLQTQITQNAQSISTEVTERKNGQKNLSSRIEQTVKSISLKINNGEKTAGIVITLENENGSKTNVTGTISMTGTVTFNDLQNAGQTVINGANITTGDINCDRLNGGEIRGQIIRGGGSDGSGYRFNVANEGVSISDCTLKIGSSIRFDPASKIAVFSTPQRILIKGKGNSPGDWKDSAKVGYFLSDGTTITAWDIGDAIQYICRHEIAAYNYDSIIDDRLKDHGLIKSE